MYQLALYAVGRPSLVCWCVLTVHCRDAEDPWRLLVPSGARPAVTTQQVGVPVPARGSLCVRERHRKTAGESYPQDLATCPTSLRGLRGLYSEALTGCPTRDRNVRISPRPIPCSPGRIPVTGTTSSLPRSPTRLRDATLQTAAHNSQRNTGTHSLGTETRLINVPETRLGPRAGPSLTRRFGQPMVLRMDRAVGRNSEILLKRGESSRNPGRA